LDAMVFLIFVLIGILTFNEAFYYYKLLFDLGDTGLSFICEYMKISWFKSVAVFCLLGVSLLWITEFIDEDCDYNEVAKKGRGLWIFTMFIVIISGALIIPSENFDDDKNFGVILKERADVSHYEGGIIASNNSEFNKDLSETLNISPITYAREKIQGLKKIILVDLRAREKYDEWHVNGSYNYPIDAIALSLDRFRKFERIVLLGSDEETSEAYKLLNNAKFTNVYILEGGIEGFKDEILNEEKALSEKINEEERLEREAWHKMFEGSTSSSSTAEPINLNSLIGAD
ncbi:MAG: rhodanese-like domain-containing protein, partial [Candidatus Riflebacteria bacterium]|nr:rhodanese-like domain-containing protein [Candidatus Riflebacteria bacterium]